MTTTDDRTDVDAAAELAAEPTIYPTTPGDSAVVLLPPGWTMEAFDEERALPRPHRARGTIAVHDAASFVDLVSTRVDDEDAVTVYFDEGRLALVAVLNDDAVSSGALSPGWRDHRVELVLRETPEWRHWAALDGELVGQEAFAEHIEDGVNELRDPAAAVMLDIAQSIHGTVSATIKSGRRLADGRVQFAYEEETSAGAGVAGELTIPDVLTLAIRPFLGGDRYELTARFRYRLPTRSEPLRLGYKLDRPQEVKRAAFIGAGDNPGIVGQVREGLPNALVVAGSAPEAA